MYRGNFSFARNHYTKIDESANAYEWEIKTGRPIKFITGYLADGIAVQMQTWLVYLNITVDSTGRKEILF